MDSRFNCVFFETGRELNVYHGDTNNHTAFECDRLVDTGYLSNGDFVVMYVVGTKVMFKAFDSSGHESSHVLTGILTQLANDVSTDCFPVVTNNKLQILHGWEMDDLARIDLEMSGVGISRLRVEAPAWTQHYTHSFKCIRASLAQPLKASSADGGTGLLYEIEFRGLDKPVRLEVFPDKGYSVVDGRLLCYVPSEVYPIKYKHELALLLIGESFTGIYLLTSNKYTKISDTRVPIRPLISEPKLGTTRMCVDSGFRIDEVGKFGCEEIQLVSGIVINLAPHKLQYCLWATPLFEITTPPREEMELASD